MTSLLVNILPHWLNLDRPDLGTVEYLKRELGNQSEPRIRQELSQLIEQTEAVVESRRRQQIGGNRAKS